MNCSWPLGSHPSPCPSLRSGLLGMRGPMPAPAPAPFGCAALAAACGVRARAAASAGPVRVSPMAAPAAAPSCALAIARGPRPSARLRQPPGAPAAAGAGPASGRPCQPGRCGPRPVGLAAPSGPLRAPLRGWGPLGPLRGPLRPSRAAPGPPCLAPALRAWVALRAPGPPPSRGRLSGPKGPLLFAAAPG